jgi:hypothetical protein
MTFSGGYEMSSPSRAKKKVNEKDEEEKSWEKNGRKRKRRLCRLNVKAMQNNIVKKCKVLSKANGIPDTWAKKVQYIQFILESRIYVEKKELKVREMRWQRRFFIKESRGGIRLKVAHMLSR